MNKLANQVDSLKNKLLPLTQAELGRAVNRVMQAEGVEQMKGKQIYLRLVAGDPNLTVTKELLLLCQSLGVEGVQIVLPFSDPMAARELLQNACDRALALGTTSTKVLNLLEELRPQLTLQLTLVTYMNPLATYGYQAFFKRCAQAGVAAVQVVDLPYEEREELLPYSQASGVALLTTLAISRPERVEQLAAQAQCYAYVCGGDRRPEINRRRVEQLVKQGGNCPVPLLVGYPGESLGEAVEYAQLAQGVILESLPQMLLAREGERALAALGAQLEQLRQLIAASSEN